MKQVFQNLSNGKTELMNKPIPTVKDGYLLIKTKNSVISGGTERTTVENSKASTKKTNRLAPLGYSNAGVVVEVGKHVKDFKVGDRVISNGSHAEYVCVPKNLCAKIPDGVDLETASFTVVSSIALQGIRLTKPTIGETFMVIGLGLIGLLTVQILKANGCQVIASDFDESKVAIAKSYGIDAINLSDGIDPVDYATKKTNGRGIDGVLITAHTKSNDPISQAANMCRKRGRIVLIGVIGLELIRSEFYAKELSFQVSCSYGPGRYDPEYEDQGRDYPLGFVRWTEQRNFEAVLTLMEDGKIDTKSLVTHEFTIDKAEQAYHVLTENKDMIALTFKYS